MVWIMKKVMAASMISLVSAGSVITLVTKNSEKKTPIDWALIDPPEKRVPVNISTTSDVALFGDDNRYSIDEDGNKIPVHSYSVCLPKSDLDNVHQAFLNHDPHYGSNDRGFDFPQNKAFFRECVMPQGEAVHTWIYYSCYHCTQPSHSLEIPSKAVKETIDQSQYRCSDDEVTFISHNPIKHCDNISVSVSIMIEL